jgi:RNA-directed DNA polymerase
MRDDTMTRTGLTDGMKIRMPSGWRRRARSGNRVVQQAVVNVTEPIFDPTFHPSVYGYRPKGSQHHAVAKAESFINRYGLTEVADMDLGRCSGTLDHGIIMDTAAERISDGRVPAPTRKFLKSGVMKEDTSEATETGSCQGWAISPLPSNIHLSRFDQKMMSGGIRIVRYADDIPIFAIDKRQATACAMPRRFRRKS